MAERSKMDHNEKPLIRENAIIIGIQILFFIAALFLTIYINITDSPETTFNINPAMFSGLVACPAAVFLGTLLLMKGLRLFYSNNAPADRFVTFRKVMYIISWVLIAAYCLFLLFVFNSFLGINLPFFISAQFGNFIIDNTTILSALTAVLFRLKNL